MTRFWLAEHADLIFYGLLIGLGLAEIVCRWLLKLAKPSLVMEYVDSGFVAILLALVIRTLVIQTFIIPSGSMENTLLIGDQLIVNKFLYGITLPFTHKKVLKIRDPKRGDIIVFRPPHVPGTRFIKRCMGLPGDRVQMKNKILYINDQPLAEPYVVWKDPSVFTQANSRDNFGPIVVPDHQYLMLGDNRDQSGDSRYWGFLPEANIEGKALVVYWPIPRWRLIK